MALFDKVNFNGEVFDTVVRNTPNTKMNALLKSGAIVEKPQYASMLSEQKGGNYISTLIKERIGGEGINYDGKTDITASARGNYTMGRIVVGRAGAWVEKDFVADISGDDYTAGAEEVSEYFDDLYQGVLINILNGTFSMSDAEGKKFADGHTLDITADKTDGTFDVTTLNTAMQKALGDNKGKFALAIMHSAVATNLENKQLVAYLKYTDKDGVQKDLNLYTLNGRLILVDDDMPVEHVDDAEGLGVFDKYTTYVLGEGAIEYTECDVKVPTEMERDALKNGGETTLISRRRRVYAPYGISWKNGNIVSPSNAQLATGSNWEIASNNDATKKSYYPLKAIAIARIITRG